MVSLREVSASKTRRLARSIEMQALQEVDEIGPGGSDRALVSEHRDEPGALVGDDDGGEQATLLVAVAHEGERRGGPGPGLHRPARPGEVRLGDRGAAGPA